MITTVQQHILQQQQEISEASGRFSWLLSGITLATKMVEAKIRIAGLSDVLGAFGQTNVQGEQQQKLDVYANQALLHCLGLRDSVAALVSEEDEEPVTFNRSVDTGRYIIVFDPLDGSSNIDVNVNVGTIFSILRRLESDHSGDLQASILQPGYTQVAAGYVVYGPSTVLVYTTGYGVHGFTLDPGVGEFFLSHPSIQCPERGSTYSINEGNHSRWDEPTRKWAQWIKSEDKAEGLPYGHRYVGTLVADAHRTLLKGGIFAYPSDRKSPGGKLRLLYEANPMAYLFEQAGGMATNGVDRILDIVPKGLHDRTPLVLGSKDDVAAFKQFALGER